MSLVNFKNPDAIVNTAVMVVVAILVLVAVLPTLIEGIGNLSTVSGLQFTSFYGTGGIVLLVLSAVVLMAVLKAIKGNSKR